MKKISVLTMVIIIIAALAMCAVGVKLLVTSDNNDSKDNEVPSASNTEIKANIQELNPQKPEIKEGIEVIATAVPDAEIITLTDTASENIRIETVGPLEYKEPENSNGFTKVRILGLSNPVWAFQGKDGTICLRTYGTRWKRINNVNQQEIEGFYKTDLLIGAAGSASVDTEEAYPVTDSTDEFAVPQRVNDNMRDKLDENKYMQIENNLFACHTKTGAEAYRTFAKVNGLIYLYDCDSSGNIQNGSLPVYAEEEIYNLISYAEGGTVTGSQYSYPVKYNQTAFVLTVDAVQAGPETTGGFR